jgi:hypothetical protein
MCLMLYLQELAPEARRKRRVQGSSSWGTLTEKSTLLHAVDAGEQHV